MFPTVNRSVQYLDREEVVAAKEQGREPEPYAAIITRVYTDRATGRIHDRVDLAVFDPELGYQIKRDVLPISDELEANGWRWPPFVNVPPATGPVSEPQAGTTPSTEPSVEESASPAADKPKTKAAPKAGARKK